MSGPKPNNFRTIVWAGALCVFLGWLGCPAPLLLPALSCEGDSCQTDATPRPENTSDTGEPTATDADGAAVEPLPASEFPDVGDLTPQDSRTGEQPGPLVDAQEAVPEIAPDKTLELPPEVQPEKKPEIQPEKKPDKPTKPKCIDKDNDKRCANKIHPTYRIDCDDSDPRVFPGQTVYFTVKNKRGSWDYNCNNRAEQKYPKYVCRPPTRGCSFPFPSADTSVPCGGSGRHTTRCLPTAQSCIPIAPYTSFKQACR